MILVSGVVYSDTITLKSGKVLEGELVKETEDYVKIKTSGFVLTYFKDTIAKHIRVKTEEPSLKKNKQEQKPKKPQQNKLFLQEYSNDYLEITKPAVWEEVTEYLYPYQSYGNKDLVRISHKAAYEEGLLILSQKERPDKPMSFSAIVKSIENEIGKNDIKKSPITTYLNGERVVNFLVKKEYNSKPVIADITIFFRGKQWYVLELVVKEKNFLAYRDMFKEILESIELH